MIVVITDEAAADLKAIGDFIADRNPRRAVSFVNEIVERCALLAEMPRRFQLVPRHEKAGIRRMPYGDYVIFYCVGAQTIEILHILNVAQDHTAVLLPEGRTTDRTEV